MSPEERLARWTAPLAAPPGDARQHPAFDQVRGETAKLDSATGGSPDWGEVLRAGDVFLAEAGRDLVVASSVATALAHREGLAGVALGARLLARLLSDAHTTPARPRARANAVAAFVARAEVTMDGAKDRSSGALEAIETALRELDAAIRTLDDEAPTLRPLEDRTRALRASLPAPTPAAPPPPVFAPPPPVSAAASAMAEALPDRPEQVQAFVRRVAAQVVPAAALLRHASVLDADALRLTLVALYLPIAVAPETTRDARTSITAPPKLVLETLAKQRDAAPPEVLVRDTLAALERHRFALDLHAHLAHGLERAGATGRAAAAIHRHELLGLCGRLPELLAREFADGTRFAGEPARTLLASWEPAKAPARDDDSEASGDPLREMHARANEGRIADALALGGDARQRARSARARFEATLAMALVAERARALPLAAELHTELLEDMGRHALDAWDPALAADALRAALRVTTASPGADALAKGLFARLARIDARAAFELSASMHATAARSGR